MMKPLKENEETAKPLSHLRRRRKALPPLSPSPAKLFAASLASVIELTTDYTCDRN
ncbi:hypothetical protein A2U01_0036172 [Trifolium medium]|uniref:Uncharacterized protein n=1 Tax=Trifolium medium TaxID=97028 RepID=A0A392PTQ2_9FABA|nr:hypothetical protein [Trifolium medium]